METSVSKKPLIIAAIVVFLAICAMIFMFTFKPSSEETGSISSSEEEEIEFFEEESDEPEELAELSPDEEDCETLLAYKFESNDPSIDEKILKCEEEFMTFSEEDWEDDEYLEEDEEDFDVDYDSDFYALFNEPDTEEE